MRAEKIRTYNFPQNRVTDHRIKKSWHNINSIMLGELDEIIDDVTQGIQLKMLENEQ
jgi:peptide chain release factor 1